MGRLMLFNSRLIKEKLENRELCCNCYQEKNVNYVFSMDNKLYGLCSRCFYIYQAYLAGLITRKELEEELSIKFLINLKNKDQNEDALILKNKEIIKFLQDYKKDLKNEKQ